MTLEAPPAAVPEATSSDVPPLERVNQPVTFLRGFWPTVREIVRYHELLTSLVRKELKVKYKDSVLGFLWTLLRPLFYLLIYYIAIGKFLRNPIPGFVVYLFTGLVVWTLFTDIVNGATLSVVGNAGLIKKVYFPREILPLAVVGASLVQFVFQLLVLFGAVLITGRHVAPGPLLLLPVSLVNLILFSTAVGLLLSAANVYLRDTQHLIELVLLFWFWMTPIVYSIGQVEQKLGNVSHLLLALFLANPVGIVALGFQRAVYQRGSYANISVVYTGNIWAREGVLFGACLVFLWVSQRIFARAQGSFAQEL
ncbi:MAG: ABC transporter permease [Mycobacteriales bacterium]